MAEIKLNPVNEVLKIFNNGWNKQVILYGPPGTSKTYSSTIIAAAMLAGAEKDQFGIYSEEKIREKLNQLNQQNQNMSLYDLASLFLENNSNYKLVQFHPSYSYEDFVRGISVKTSSDKVTGIIKDGQNNLELELNNNGTISYEVEPKIIEKFCNQATSDESMVLVIDEINRAPLASVLGELIYGLEYRGKDVSTPYYLEENGNEKPLKIPENLYIIGTMNTADRSIGSIDYAVRRRFAFVPVLSNPDVIKKSWKNSSVGLKALNIYKAMMYSEDGLFTTDLMEDPELDVDDIKIGHTYFLGKQEGATEEEELAYLRYRIDYQIKPIYKEYIKDGLIKKEGEDRLDKIIKSAFEQK